MDRGLAYQALVGLPGSACRVIAVLHWELAAVGTAFSNIRVQPSRSNDSNYVCGSKFGVLVWISDYAPVGVGLMLWTKLLLWPFTYVYSWLGRVILRTPIYGVIHRPCCVRSVQLSATNDDLRRSDRANVKYTHSYNTPSEYGSQWVMGDSSDEEYSNILQMLVVCPKSHTKVGVPLAEKLRHKFTNSKLYGDYRTGNETVRSWVALCMVSLHRSLDLTRRQPVACRASACVF